ncbi:MAG TPA: PEGA domain-containing protein [Terriglobia bacterium]|nr:PEGA domain-containing protein [Terriglobia bacterium]
MPYRCHRKTISGFTPLALLMQVSVALALSPSTLKIPDSTPVQLTLMDRLNSATSEIDDPVHLEVAEDVKVRGIVVIPKGSLATGHVVSVHHRGRLGRPGQLVFSVDFIRAPDGADISVRQQSARKGRNKPSGLPTPMHVLAKGRDLEIPQGTHILAYVNGNHEIASSEAAAPSPAPNSNGTVSPARSSDISSVAVTSTPNHSDITVDGKFLGTTPSTVRISSGDHSVTIEKEGFKAWQRVMTLVPGGSITLDVTLDKIP